MDDTHVCGFVAVVGRPNVGKSTLINALVGRKISIVTPKPQTTRQRVLGILSQSGSQIVFVDTPGLHRAAGRAMNRLMNRTAVSALADADLILFVTEAGRWTDEDQDVLDRIARVSTPAFAVLNKIDRLQKKEQLLAHLEEAASRHGFAEIIPVSARRKLNIDELLNCIPRYLPVSPPLFPGDAQTDRSDEFRAAEIVREKLTLLLRQELPYGLTVQVEQLERRAKGLTIHAIIWVERESQKGIVVGKGGENLKRAGKAARLDLKREFATAVHLELWVKVRANWSDNEQDLKRLGYELP